MPHRTDIGAPGRDDRFDGPGRPGRPAGRERIVPEDVDPARRLFARVIELALQDHEYLERTRSKTELSKQDSKRLRAITESVHPDEFFDSTWFEQVCEMVGIQPQAVRDRL